MPHAPRHQRVRAAVQVVAVLAAFSFLQALPARITARQTSAPAVWMIYGCYLSIHHGQDQEMRPWSLPPWHSVEG